MTALELESSTLGYMHRLSTPDCNDYGPEMVEDPFQSSDAVRYNLYCLTAIGLSSFVPLTLLSKMG
jgi:hypothetical protein